MCTARPHEFDLWVGLESNDVGDGAGLQTGGADGGNDGGERVGVL